MRRITILDRYVAREVLGPFVVGVGLLTFALVTGRLLKFTEMVVNHGVTLREVLTLLGVLIGFCRMSGDRELIAARACGVSLYRLAVPVLMVALVVWALSTWFAFSLRPWANARLQDRLFDLTQTNSAAGFKDKIFNRNFPGLVVYVDEISPSDQTLKGVMISDARNPGQQNTII